MPTISQLVRKGRKVLVDKSKSPETTAVADSGTMFSRKPPVKL